MRVPFATISILLRATACGALVFIAGCTESPSSSWKVSYDSSRIATSSVRVGLIAKTMRIRPPSPVLDTDFLEESMGDGDLGPSDRRMRIRLKLRPNEVRRWRTASGAPIHVDEWPTSPADPAWWPLRPNTADYDFYSAATLFHGSNGWIAIKKKDPEHLFITKYSM